MRNEKSQKSVSGWIEVLFRKKTSPVSSIKGPKDIHLSDYIMPGSKMPLTEFESAIDIYEFYASNKELAGRFIKEFDIVNLVFLSPKIWIKTLILLDPYSDISKKFYFSGSEKLAHWVPDRLPLCMQPLQIPLGPYCKTIK
jgi:hypothetical protein